MRGRRNWRDTGTKVATPARRLTHGSHDGEPGIAESFIDHRAAATTASPEILSIGRSRQKFFAPAVGPNTGEAVLALD